MGNPAVLRALTRFEGLYKINPKVSFQGEPCHIWTGSVTEDGYGMFSWAGRKVIAHRWVYEAIVGPIPEGLELDHLCKNRGCVNTQHLEVLTHNENLRRSNTVGARNRDKSHCPQGHAYTDENIYSYKGKRYCRACRRGE